MRYQHSYQQAFVGPNWGPNLLYCSGCALIPFVGWAALIGYAVETLEVDPDGKAPPAFEPSRLKNYFVRGLWPATVQLLVVIPTLVLTAVGVLLVAHLMADPKHSAPSVRLVASVLAPGLFLLALLQTVVLLPLTLYTGFGGVGTVGAAWQFTQGFLVRVGKELFLAQVFLVTTGLAIGAVGAIPCLIGLPPALALVTLAQYHLMAQLYQLYQSRGGPNVADFVEPAPAPGMPA